MRLVKMTSEDFDFWSLRSKKNYADDKIRANRLTRNEAEKIAERDFQRLLPEGFESKDNYLFSVKDDQHGKVGYLWFCIRGSTDNRKAFVCDIIIEEEFRGKGYGKATMNLLENEVQKLGLTEIGLHVFGFNKVAIQLYKSLGYATTDLVMAKQL